MATHPSPLARQGICTESSLAGDTDSTLVAANRRLLFTDGIKPDKIILVRLCIHLCDELNEYVDIVTVSDIVASGSDELETLRTLSFSSLSLHLFISHHHCHV